MIRRPPRSTLFPYTTLFRSPSTWPDHLDLDRAREFMAGYEEICSLGADMLRSLPYLMIEALIAESVLPIAATGSFGPFDGFGFMQMVRRKVAWLQEHHKTLQAIADSTSEP